MPNTVTQTVKNIFVYGMANSTLQDARTAILNDESFLEDVRNRRNATIYLSKKHIPFIVEKTINDMLIEQQYKVYSIKYSLLGMKVLVSPQ